MVYELERVLRVCNGFLCSISVTYDGAVLHAMHCVCDKFICHCFSRFSRITSTSCVVYYLAVISLEKLCKNIQSFKCDMDI